MGAASARLDAYAHHPYPLGRASRRRAQRGCTWRVRDADDGALDRLVTKVQRAFGAKRIWLTEYGYQTNPPDRTILGVSYARQARYLGEAALRVPGADVDMLIHFLVQDDSRRTAGRAGSDAHGEPKPSRARSRSRSRRCRGAGARRRSGARCGRERRARLPAAGQDGERLALALRFAERRRPGSSASRCGAERARPSRSTTRPRIGSAPRRVR